MTEADAQSPKRRQILDGARRVFLAHGFSGASMNDIAHAAGVSKGTLYVHFENKERLFFAIVKEERNEQVAGLVAIDHGDRDVARVLTTYARSLIDVLSQPRMLSAIRMIISIAEQMPELGQQFFREGYGVGRTKLADYLAARVKDADLVIDDVALAATQFLEMVVTATVRPLLFGEYEQFKPDRIEALVRSGVAMFLSFYGAPAARMLTLSRMP